MLIHKNEQSEARLKAGDVVRFVSVTEQEYRAGLQFLLLEFKYSEKDCLALS